MIKYLRIPDEIFDMVKEDIVINKARGRTDNQKNRAPRGARQGKIFKSINISSSKYTYYFYI